MQLLAGLAALICGCVSLPPAGDEGAEPAGSTVPTCVDGLRDHDGVTCPTYGQPGLQSSEGVLRMATVTSADKSQAQTYYHIDWTLRDDEACPSSAYGFVRFSMSDGHAYEVRVYCDGAVKAGFDGSVQGTTKIPAAATFASSPGIDKPHAQFEFVLTASLCTANCTGGVAGFAVALTFGGPGPGASAKPVDADAIGDETLQPLGDVPILVGIRSAVLDWRLKGARLGIDPGEVIRDAGKASTSSWKAVEVGFVAADLQAGELVRIRRKDGKVSNPVFVPAAELPTLVPGSCAFQLPGVACDDGKPCTTADGCDGKGACVGTSTCPPSANACESNTCTGLGTCQIVVAANGVVAATLDACTQQVCQGGKPVVASTSCDDGNPCTQDSCDTAQGCMNTALDGTSCDDGESCTGSDTCKGGTCKGVAIQGCE